MRWAIEPFYCDWRGLVSSVRLLLTKCLLLLQYEGDEYAIIKVGMPLFLVAKAPDLETGIGPDGFELLGDEENERLATLIQAELDLQFGIEISEE